jgi:Sulfotransferase family
MDTMAWPDFFLIGAPKAGTTALHAALARHPDLYLSPVKEPKYFLCGDRPPVDQNGPGDAHSAQEWVWRRDRYLSLFHGAPTGALRGESTPFYLYDLAAQRRIAAAVPAAKVVALLRDPVDRAYSNWLHLWSDGLEPIGDFLAACDAEDRRVAAGYAPFWHYRRLGRYGEQFAHLFELFPRQQVLVLRYRQLVDQPQQTLDAVCAFLGVEPGRASAPGAENTRPFVADTAGNRALSRLIRAGAAAGAYAPPRMWRAASGPLLSLLQRGGTARPRLTVAERRTVLAPLVDDIHHLGQLLGRPFDDWLGDEGAGEFLARRTGLAS